MLEQFYCIKNVISLKKEKERKKERKKKRKEKKSICLNFYSN
jgi:hypothetical protein